MIPKDKAKELYGKMYMVDDPMGNYTMCYDTAKQCALIAVDEILKNYYKNHFQTGKKIDYWLEVKIEIQKL